MATNFINNLSNTYQQSPSLQNQFATEQDYLDLFDKNQVTPQMAQAFNINDYEFEDQDQGIKSIINTAAPIINPGGDNDNRPPSGPTDLGITSDNFGLGLDDQTGMGYELTDKDRSDINKQKTKQGLGTLASVLGFFSNPVGFFVGRYAKQQYKEYKARKARDLQKEIKADNEAAANRSRVEQYTGKPMSDYRQSRPRSEQNFTGGGPQANDPIGGFENKSGMGRTGYKYGNRVKRSYFKGGLVSLRGK